MNMFTYLNTKSTLPNQKEELHKSHHRGYAYETDTHFVHFYGQTNEMWVISTELTVTEKKKGTLREWIEKTFGATNIESLKSNIGRNS